jgi:hypothetical protein
MALKSKNELHLKKMKNASSDRKKFLNRLMNLAHGCLCSDYVDGYAMAMFLF